MSVAEDERALLGAIIGGWRDLDSLGVQGSDFDRPWHEAVYNTCAKLIERGDRCDAVTVRNSLPPATEIRRPENVDVDLQNMQESCPVVVHAPRYAKIVTDAADLRGLSRAALRIQQLVAERDPDKPVEDLIEDARAYLDRAPRRAGTPLVTLSDVLRRTIDRLEQGTMLGTMSPWPDLDRLTNGFQKSRLYVVAARPGCGKSLFGQGAALHFAQKGLPVAVSMMEMPDDEMGVRILSAAGAVDMGHMYGGRIDDRDWSQINDAVGRLDNQPVFIDDTADQNMTHIRRHARDVKRRHGLGAVVVDYIQLIKARSTKDSREQQVAQISRSLKLLSRELEVPVIALAQLNRGSLQRTDKTPGLGDLRESGAIEQDADVVILLHRDDDEFPGELKCIVPKNRNGQMGECMLRFRGHLARLENVS